jgi:hypothetical protein
MPYFPGDFKSESHDSSVVESVRISGFRGLAVLNLIGHRLTLRKDDEVRDQEMSALSI